MNADEGVDVDSEGEEMGQPGTKARVIKRWGTEETTRLQQLVAAQQATGTTEICWAQIAKELPGRTGKQCRHRWVNSCQPYHKRGTWDLDEEEVVARLHAVHGSAWSHIASKLQGRSENSVKNHFNALCRSKYLDSKRDSVLANYVKLLREGHVQRQETFDQALNITLAYRATQAANMSRRAAAREAAAGQDPSITALLAPQPTPLHPLLANLVAGTDVPGRSSGVQGSGPATTGIARGDSGLIRTSSTVSKPLAAQFGGLAVNDLVQPPGPGLLQPRNDQGSGAGLLQPGPAHINFNLLADLPHGGGSAERGSSEAAGVGSLMRADSGSTGAPPPASASQSAARSRTPSSAHTSLSPSELAAGQWPQQAEGFGAPGQLGMASGFILQARQPMYDAPKTASGDLAARTTASAGQLGSAASLPAFTGLVGAGQLSHVVGDAAGGHLGSGEAGVWTAGRTGSSLMPPMPLSASTTGLDGGALTPSHTTVSQQLHALQLDVLNGNPGLGAQGAGPHMGQPSPALSLRRGVNEWGELMPAGESPPTAPSVGAAWGTAPQYVRLGSAGQHTADPSVRLSAGGNGAVTADGAGQMCVDRTGSVGRQASGLSAEGGPAPTSSTGAPAVGLRVGRRRSYAEVYDCPAPDHYPAESNSGTAASALVSQRTRDLLSEASGALPHAALYNMHSGTGLGPAQSLRRGSSTQLSGAVGVGGAAAGAHTRASMDHNSGGGHGAPAATSRRSSLIALDRNIAVDVNAASDMADGRMERGVSSPGTSGPAAGLPSGGLNNGQAWGRARDAVFLPPGWAPPSWEDMEGGYVGDVALQDDLLIYSAPRAPRALRSGSGEPGACSTDEPPHASHLQGALLASDAGHSDLAAPVARAAAGGLLSPPPPEHSAAQRRRHSVAVTSGAGWVPATGVQPLPMGASGPRRTNPVRARRRSAEPVYSAGFGLPAPVQPNLGTTPDRSLLTRASNMDRQGSAGVPGSMAGHLHVSTSDHELVHAASVGATQRGGSAGPGSNDLVPAWALLTQSGASVPGIAPDAAPTSLAFSHAAGTHEELLTDGELLDVLLCSHDMADVAGLLGDDAALAGTPGMLALPDLNDAAGNSGARSAGAQPHAAQPLDGPLTGPSSGAQGGGAVPGTGPGQAEPTHAYAAITMNGPYALKHSLASFDQDLAAEFLFNGDAGTQPMTGCEPSAGAAAGTPAGTPADAAGPPANAGAPLGTSMSLNSLLTGQVAGDLAHAVDSQPDWLH